VKELLDVVTRAYKYQRAPALVGAASGPTLETAGDTMDPCVIIGERAGEILKAQYKL
jgi:hypothetical protein